MAETSTVLDTAQELRAAGFYPIWGDIKHIRKCDGVLRGNGYSAEADQELEFAKAWDIPIFYSLIAVTAYFFKERLRGESYRNINL